MPAAAPELLARGCRAALTLEGHLRALCSGTHREARGLSHELLRCGLQLLEGGGHELPQVPAPPEQPGAPAGTRLALTGGRWRRYSGLCADMLRSVLKEPAKGKAKAREVVYFRSAQWADGKPQKQVITDLQEVAQAPH